VTIVNANCENLLLAAFLACSVYIFLTCFSLTVCFNIYMMYPPIWYPYSGAGIVLNCYHEHLFVTH